MIKALQAASRFLASYTPHFIIGIALLTFLVPDLFTWVKGNTQTAILGFIMLTMGLTLSTNDFKVLLSRPFDIFIGACAQFILMPLIAYTLVHVFHLDRQLAIGILLVGCCPGGVSSNIMSYLCNGDVAFSVGMTCASTLLAPLMTPLLMQLTAGEIVEIDTVGMFVHHSERDAGFQRDWTCMHRRRSGQCCSRQTHCQRTDGVPVDLLHRLLSQQHRISARIYHRQALPFQQSQETDHQHRGGNAERRTRHQPRLQFLRRHKSAVRGALRH